MTCKVLLLTFLGTTTPANPVPVPAAAIEQYKPAQIERAKACARRHGIRWVIVN